MDKIIMILTNGFEPDVRVYKEAQYLLSKNYEVTILCWDRNTYKNLPEHEIIDGIEIVRFKISSVLGSGIRQLGKYIKYLLKCKKHLHSNEYKYIHCNDIDGAIVGWLAGKKKSQMVFDMHEFYEHGNSVKRWVWRRLTIFLLKRSFAGLYENAAYLSDKYKTVRNKLYPLRNYPDSNMVQYREKTNSESFRVAYHGVVRGQMPEFEALFKAVKGLDNVRVDVNGGGPILNQLIDLAKKYENVYVNGPYNGMKETSSLYAKTDVLFCGYNPNDPNYQGDAEVIKYYEAIYTGTPMIMTKKTGMGKKVEKYGFGIACDTRNPEEIKKAIIKFKTDFDFWERCSNNEQQSAGNYSWESAVKVLDKVYIH